MSIECRHCTGSGTCTTGENGVSCESCVKKARETSVPFWFYKIESKKGLPCGACGGAGDIEGRAWQTQMTIGPFLGIIIVMFVLMIVLVIATQSPTHHAEILTLLGTLAGSVVGFYFKGQHTLPKAPHQRPGRQRVQAPPATNPQADTGDAS